VEQCRHTAPVHNYESITMPFVDRECLEYYDGPILGTASCAFCETLFLFEQQSSRPSEDVWVYCPITPEDEQNYIQGKTDPFEAVKLLRRLPHLVVTQPWYEAGPCTVKWSSPSD
jgi:hypothetical protein